VLKPSNLFHRTPLLAILIGTALGGGAHYFSGGAGVASRGGNEVRGGSVIEQDGSHTRPSVAAIMASEGLESSLLCLRWLEKATAADCAAAAPSLATGPKDHEWSDHRSWIFYQRWAELDPKAATAFCLAEKYIDLRGLAVILEVWGRSNFSEAWAAAEALPEEPRTVACVAALKGLAAVDPHRAWAEVLAHKDIKAYDGDKLEIISSMARLDPAGAVALLPSIDVEQEKARGIFGMWGARDLPAAWAYATGLAEEYKRDAACQGILERLINSDLTAAQKFLATFPPDSMVSWKGKLAEQFAYQDPAGARSWAEGLAAGPGRLRALAGVALVLTRSGQPEEALPVFASMNWQLDPPEQRKREVFTESGSSASSAVSWGAGDFGREVSSAMAAALSVWGRRDPAAALKQTSEALATANDGAMWAGINIVSAWAERDPAAAFTAVVALPKDSVEFRDRLLGNVMDAWVRQDFSAAQTAFDSLPAGEIRSKAAKSLIGQLMHQDPSAAFDWAVQHDTDAKGELIKYAFDGSIRSIPQAALEKFDSLQVSAELRHDLAVSMADRLKDDEPLLAVNVLLKESIADNGLGRSLESYLRQFPTAASEWVKALPNGEVRETSISTLASYLQGQDEPDFQAAFIWAQTMQASEKRDEAVLETLRSWEKGTPGAAKQALEASKLPPAERSRLLEMLSKPPVYSNDPFAP
jgi:hypothetical protein